jgi:hypothetical protein
MFPPSGHGRDLAGYISRSHHLKKGTDALSETFCLLVILNLGRWLNCRDPVILSVLLRNSLAFPVMSDLTGAICREV